MKKILFVCVENAGRSQMAEAFFKKYAPSQFQVISAGTKPSQNVNPIVAKVMEEVGIDIQGKIPQSISNGMLDGSTVINMGCIDKESCPALFVSDVIDWGIDDPKGKPIEEVRVIRDHIEDKVKTFIKNLER